MKGLALAYNRDLQEDKEPVFDTVDTLVLVLPALAGMVETLEFNTDRMAVLAPEDFSLATDVAEWLVKQGVAFREAHEICGELVTFCEKTGLQFHELSDAQFSDIDPRLNGDVRAVLSIEASVAARDGHGGTAPVRVAEQIRALTSAAAAAREGW
jgi:argininosuccinate lyase